MILLVQFRDDQAGWHELKCVYSALNIPYSQYKVVNVLSPFVTQKSLGEDFRRADKIILGGAGKYGWELYSSGDEKRIKVFNSLLNKITRPLKNIVIKDKRPILGICFGHQLLAYVLGCQMGVDDNQAESGVFEVYLSNRGIKNPLFKKMKNSFKAVLGHKTSIIATTNDRRFKVLASSKKCLVQAFQYGKNTYGVQFHPELDYDDLMFRLSLYPSYKETKKISRQKTEAKQVLKNFSSF